MIKRKKTLIISAILVISILTSILVGCSNKNSEPQNYSINIATFTNGTVIADKTEAKQGDTVKLTISPSTGYILKENSLKATYGTDNKALEINNNTFTMPSENVTVIAEFIKNPNLKYAINIATFTNGTVIADKTEAKQGDTVKLTISPSTGYILKENSLKATYGTDNKALEINNNTFTMPSENVTVIAEFIKNPNLKYAINIATFTNGTVTADKTEAKQGDTVKLTIFPSTRYILKENSLKATYGTDNKALEINNNTFTMPSENVTVIAEFIKDINFKYDINVNYITNGGTLVLDKQKAKLGETVTFTIEEDYNYLYKFSSLEIKQNSNGQNIDIENNSFVMPEGDITITIDFIKGSQGLNYEVEKYNDTEEIIEYKVMGRGTFDGEDLIIPQEYNGIPVTVINLGAFKSDQKLTSVKTFSNLINIGINSFDECINLTSVELVDGLLKISNNAFSNTGITEINLPSTIIELGTGIFKNCANLAKATFSEGITKVGNDMFRDSGLQEIILSSTILSIGDHAFDRCKLKTIYILNPSTTERIILGSYVFEFVPFETIYFVSQEVLDFYSNNSNNDNLWAKRSQYFKVIEA